MTAETAEPHIDYTDINHHQDIPDSADTGDPSRPQGPFWHPEERERAPRPVTAVQIGHRPRVDACEPDGKRVAFPS